MRLLQWLMVLVALGLAAVPAKAQDEAFTVEELQQKVMFLSSMVSEMQVMLLEIVQRTEESNKVTQNIVEIIRGNKEIYENNKEKLDVAVQSCDEMITKNGETLYRCKIKLGDGVVPPVESIKPIMNDTKAAEPAVTAKKETKKR